MWYVRDCQTYELISHRKKVPGRYDEIHVAIFIFMHLLIIFDFVFIIKPMSSAK